MSSCSPGASPTPARPSRECRARPAELATDRLCRIYRLTPTTVERLLVGPTARGLDYAALPDPVVLVDDVDPVGIAVDDDDRLFLADAGTRSIAVLDLWSRRLLRTVAVATPARPQRRPAGLAAHGGVVFAVVQEPEGLLRLTATRGPEELPLTRPTGLPADAVPARVSVLPDGEPVLLWLDATGRGWLQAGDRDAFDVGGASDLVVDADGAVVVAPCPTGGATWLRRFVPGADRGPNGWSRAHPLDAGGYDGSGLVLTRDGRIGYFADVPGAGFRLAVAGRVDYETDGTCLTYRLDSGVPRNAWGRVLVEACLPEGTACLVGTVTTDDEFETAVPPLPPEPAACEPATPAATPALPPARLVPDPAGVDGGLHRRPAPVTPWWTDPDGFATFEAPVHAAPGRYLWVTLRLRGNRRHTPRVRELRVEQRTHVLMRRLPAVFAADERQAGFLHRYLAVLDALTSDLELRSRARDLLVDPEGTPAEALDWLASFVGLVLDDRWAVEARRRLVREIVLLYRRRGTLGALTTYIAIFLAGNRALVPGRRMVEPVIIEHFRLRGVGGPLLGEDPATSSRSVVGHGFRVGGAVGTDDDPAGVADDDGSAFATHAHRFTVLVPQPLTAEQDAAIRHILDTERPAHTTYEMCTVAAGMRVGSGLHVGISSMVGPTGAFASLVLDRGVLGTDGILGRPTTGVAVEAGRVGSARVG